MGYPLGLAAGAGVQSRAVDVLAVRRYWVRHPCYSLGTDRSLIADWLHPRAMRLLRILLGSRTRTKVPEWMGCTMGLPRPSYAGAKLGIRQGRMLLSFRIKPSIQVFLCLKKGRFVDTPLPACN
jgi:hypothetical protein